MKWVDYREALGIGFNDDSKLQMLKNKIIAHFDAYKDYYSADDYYNYAVEVGERFYHYEVYEVAKSLSSETTTAAFISKCVAFYNCCEHRSTYDDNYNLIDSKKVFWSFLIKSLDDLNVSVDKIEDDGEMFLFPKGAKELDDALVSEPLEWLNDYPNGRKAFVKALKNYSEMKDGEASSVADNLRKALEAFFQEFFGGSKSLENYKGDYGTYLKDRAVPKEISNNFETLLKSYTDYNNSYAKHHDKSEKNVLEYLLYQTGNIIRLLITLKQEEAKNAD